ncbi:hypothetical protein MalM14_30120 [Gimesia chilikensis]|nr:hypothetical protein MalM14_30120 [Gimesia chilikensis]
MRCACGMSQALSGPAATGTLLLVVLILLLLGAFPRQTLYFLTSYLHTYFQGVFYIACLT